MNINILDQVILSDDKTYVVVGKADYEEKTYYCFIELGHAENVKICFINENKVVEVEDSSLVRNLMVHFYQNVPDEFKHELYQNMNNEN